MDCLHLNILIVYHVDYKNFNLNLFKNKLINSENVKIYNHNEYIYTNLLIKYEAHIIVRVADYNNIVFSKYKSNITDITDITDIKHQLIDTIQNSDRSYKIKSFL